MPAKGLPPRPRRWIASAAAPATTPQKAEPMPAIVTPESVTRKVISAASRCDSSPHRRGQAAADGAQQRKARDGRDQLLRKGRQEPRDRGAEQADHHVDGAAAHRRGVAPRRIFVRLAAHADGAVMALRLSAKAPKGASTSVARPLIVMSFETGRS